MSLYVDSSALLKRYVDESDSETAESFLRSDPSLLTARHTIVEVRSNLARLLDEREAAAARSTFLEDLGVLSIVELDEVTCEMAAAIAEVTGARTLDALHLAAAQRVGGAAVPFLTFRSAPGATGAGPGAHRWSAPERPQSRRAPRADVSNEIDVISRWMIATTGHGESSPPPLLRLAGHPLRWRLLSELARSDRRVGELCALAARRQSLVSYHLRQLRDGGLVTMRRSAADGRDTYYALDLVRCGELLSSAGVSLHPGLAQTPRPRAVRDPGATTARVLFLCTGNSARSQIAEALAERLSGGTVTAASAGSHPKPLHPNAVRVMRERGIDLAGRRSKHLAEFAAQRFDYVISLCDRVREVCPEFPGGPGLIHWSIPDPAREPGSDEETLPAFERTATELCTRVGFLIAAIEQSTTTTTGQEVTERG